MDERPMRWPMSLVVAASELVPSRVGSRRSKAWFSGLQSTVPQTCITNNEPIPGRQAGTRARRNDQHSAVRTKDSPHRNRPIEDQAAGHDAGHGAIAAGAASDHDDDALGRAAEQTSELQSLMRTSYAAFC